MAQLFLLSSYINAIKLKSLCIEIFKRKALDNYLTMEKAIEWALKLFHKGAVTYTQDKYEYEKTKEIITLKLDKIAEGIAALQISNLRAAIEHFKIALTTIKIQGIITASVKKELEEARKLAIIAFDAVSNNDDRTIATKIIIVASVFLFYEDRVFLATNIHSALERLLEHKMIRTTAESECRDDWSFWKESREKFIETLRDLVIRCYRIIQKESIALPITESKMPPMETKLAVSDKLLSSINIDRDDYSRFLFWERICSPKAYKFTSLTIYDNRHIILGLSNGAILRIKQNSERRWQIDAELEISKEKSPVEKLTTFPNGQILSKIGSKHHLIDTAGTQELIHRFSDIFLHIISNTTIISLDKHNYPTLYTFLNGKWEPELLNPINWRFGITSACELLPGVIVTVHKHTENMTRGSYRHTGDVCILRKNTEGKWESYGKIFLENHIQQVGVSPKGQIIILTTYDIRIIVPADNPEGKLSGDIDQKWTTIQLPGFFCDRQENCFKILNNGTIIGGFLDCIMIWTPSSIINTYHVEKIKGTKSQICAIDQLLDKRIVTLNVGGCVMIHGFDYS